jgi:cobalt/nickel transport system permease protein
MKDRIWLLLYVVAVVVATSFHDVRLLASMLAAAILLAGRTWWRIVRRALIAVAWFSSLVLVAYAVTAWIQGTFSGHYLGLVTLRVVTITTMTLVLASRVDLVRAFGFSRTLLYLVTLVTSQVLTMRRMLDEFRLAFRSRGITRPSRKALVHHGAAIATFFIHKSVNDATEISQAMRSRGFFDAQG